MHTKNGKMCKDVQSRLSKKDPASSVSANSSHPLTRPKTNRPKGKSERTSGQSKAKPDQKAANILPNQGQSRPPIKSLAGSELKHHPFPINRNPLPSKHPSSHLEKNKDILTKLGKLLVTSSLSTSPFLREMQIMNESMSGLSSRLKESSGPSLIFTLCLV